MMEEILKAIEDMKREINKRIDILEAHQYKENTLLIRDVHKIVTSENKPKIQIIKTASFPQKQKN